MLGRRVIVACVLCIVLLGAMMTYGAATKVTYFHRSTRTELNWAEEVIRRFEMSHPDIEVELWDSGTDGGSAYQEKLTVLRAAGNAPDVFAGYADKLGFIVRGFAADITPLAERDKAELDIDGFFPGVWETPTYQGRQYGIPLAITTQLVFYNVDMLLKHALPRLPADWDDTTWTWDRLLEYGKRLTVVDANGNFVQLALTQATENKLCDVCWMFGGDWFAPQAYETGWVDRVTLTREENIRAYRALVELYANYAAAGPPKGLSRWTDFVQGKIAMDWIGGFRMDTILNTRQSGGIKFDIAIGPVPLVNNRANTRWTDPLFMSSTTKNPEAAWAFMKYATNHESQELWVKITRKMPARRTASVLYIDALSDVFAMSKAEISSALGGSVVHSRRSIEEAIFDVPMEIIRQTSTWITPMLEGKRPVESTLEGFEAYLNAYAQELKARL